MPNLRYNLPGLSDCPISRKHKMKKKIKSLESSYYNIYKTNIKK